MLHILITQDWDCLTWFDLIWAYFNCTKIKLGLGTWYLKSVFYICMKIDELYFRPLEFGIDNMLGHIVDLKKEDYLCVEVSNLYNVLLT